MSCVASQTKTRPNDDKQDTHAYIYNSPSRVWLKNRMRTRNFSRPSSSLSYVFCWLYMCVSVCNIFAYMMLVERGKISTKWIRGSVYLYRQSDFQLPFIYQLVSFAIANIFSVSRHLHYSPSLASVLHDCEFEFALWHINRVRLDDDAMCDLDRDEPQDEERV